MKMDLISRLVTKIKETINRPFFRSSFLVLLANGIANVLNYSYHLITGRLLTPEEYGLIESLIAATCFLGILSSTFSFSVIDLAGKVEKDLVLPTVIALEKVSTIFSLIIWLVLLFAFPLIGSFLKISNFLIFLIFSLQALFVLLPIIYQSVLRARLRFFEFCLIMVFSTLAKPGFALFSIIFDWGVTGATLGLVALGLVSFLMGWFLVRRLFPVKTLTEVKIDPHFWHYSFLSLIVNIALTSIFSSDVLLVRHFFSGFQSGIYAAASVLGKMIFFGAISILLVIFPYFVKFKKDAKKLKYFFWLSFLFLAVVSLLGVIFFSLFPEVAISLIYGKEYLAAREILSQYSLFVAILVLFNLLIQFLLALGKKEAGWLSSVIAVLQIVVVLFRHSTLSVVIENSTIVVFIGFTLGLCLVLKVINEKPQ